MIGRRTMEYAQQQLSELHEPEFRLNRRGNKKRPSEEGRKHSR
jgi:hypothetical protein